MRIKLDENLPNRLQMTLSDLGHDVDTVRDEGFQGAGDDTVWDAAQQARRFLITQDLDFSDLRKFVFGKHTGILVIRLVDPGRQRLLSRTKAIFETEDVEQWSGCFVVATDHKIRIRRNG